jgi:flagellin-like protein
LIRTKNVRNTTKFKRSIKAISPVIATLLMIAIAVVASLVAYAWVMGYMGFTTNNAGKAIQIQSFASSAGTVAGPLVVYLQNVGQGIVDLNPAGSVFVNDVLYPIVDANTGATIVDKITLTEKKTEALTIGDGLGGFYMYTPGTKITIKVVTTSGTFMQQTYPGSSYNPAGPYTVNFVLGTGGLTIDPAGSDIFDAGTVVSITATPDTGYHFLEWIKTGSISISVPSSASTTATINGAGTITATFSTTTPLTHTITASAATNGAISPSGTVTVNDGADQPFTITADPNFHVLDVLVDGSSVGPQVSYTFTNVIANGHTISATFAADLPSQYTIAASASAGGTIDPSGSVLVNSGQNQVFDITAAAHYHIADVVVDSISVGTPSSYTFTGVTDDHTIAASFDIDTFTITPSAGDNGAISPSAPQIVNYGDNSPTFTVTASSGYRIIEVLADSISVGGAGLTTFDYQFINVQASHTISATFEQIPAAQHQVSFAQTGSGATVTVSYQIDGGTSQTGNCPFNVMVSEGSQISYTYPTPIGTSGTRYVISTPASPASPQTMGTSNIAVTAAYKTQCLLTVKTNGLPSAYNTVVRIAGTPTTDDYGISTINDASTNGWRKWFDSTVGTDTIGVTSTISGAAHFSYNFKIWSDATTTNPHATINMGNAATLTVTYDTKFSDDFSAATITSPWIVSGDIAPFISNNIPHSVGDNYVVLSAVNGGGSIDGRITVAVDTRGFTSGQITLWGRMYQGSSTSLSVQYSTDGGNNWVSTSLISITSQTWNSYSTALPSGALGQQDFQLRFRINGDNNQFAAVDDVVLTLSP